VSFITIRRGQFFAGEHPFVPLGMNLWYGQDLGLTAAGQARLSRELDRLAALGINHLRVMAGSEGPDHAPWRVSPSMQPKPGQYQEAHLRSLDHLLVEMGKRDLRAVMCLSNFWPWTGGFAQYRSWSTGEPIPYPPPAPDGDWLRFMRFSAGFFVQPEALKRYQAHVTRMVSRVNALTSVPYAEDPTIMAWQLANEPRGLLHVRAYRRWVSRSAAAIRALAPQQLISLGSEGRTQHRLAGTAWSRVHREADLDYATCHLWLQNWGWYDPQRPEATFESGWRQAQAYLAWHERRAARLGMPLILEEVGLARDQLSHNPGSSTQWRDRYYRRLLATLAEGQAQGSPLAGIAFWGWGGEGRPAVPQGLWHPGHDLIGDPPHEHQGWYSIFDQDQETLAVLQAGLASLPSRH
jgi:mannan endo-1,4-beta-mannosidase